MYVWEEEAHAKFLPPANLLTRLVLMQFGIYLTDRNSWAIHSTEFGKVIYMLMFILSPQGELLVAFVLKA